MQTIILGGKQVADSIQSKIAEEIMKHELTVNLSIIQVGDNEASNIYVRNKVRKARGVGIGTRVQKLKENVKQEELNALVEETNRNPEVTGFFIQAPLPRHLDLLKACALIDPEKDVDGMSPVSLGNLFDGIPGTLAPATALAVMELIRSVPDFIIRGKHAVIINRSSILGKPLAALLLKENATVTICHSMTQHLRAICKQSDILIAGTGRAGFITKDFVKKDAVVIDCGAPKAEVDFESVNGTAGYLSPVPGGVGPLTIACLLRNCQLAEK